MFEKSFLDGDSNPVEKMVLQVFKWRKNCIDCVVEPSGVAFEMAEDMRFVLSHHIKNVIETLAAQ